MICSSGLEPRALKRFTFLGHIKCLQFHACDEHHGMGSMQACVAALRCLL